MPRAGHQRPQGPRQLPGFPHGDECERRQRSKSLTWWRSGCFAGEAARAGGRRWPRRGGRRCPGPCDGRRRSAVRIRPARCVAGAGARRPPAPDFGGEAAGVRRRAWCGGAGGAFAGSAAAPRRVALLRRVAGLPLAVHPGSGEAGGVAARPGSLQLCRPPQRAALRLPLSAGDRPHRAVRARRRFQGAQPQAALRSAPQVAPCSRRECPA